MTTGDVPYQFLLLGLQTPRWDLFPFFRRICLHRVRGWDNRGRIGVDVLSVR
jgi:hypothetical protein